MLVIRTAEEMARALDSPLDPELKRILAEHWARLVDYDLPLSDLAEFVIAKPGDTLADLEAATAMTLVAYNDGQPTFALGPEIVQQHAGCTELVWILSDDGYGLVLLVVNAAGIDPMLKSACDHELQALANVQAGDRP